LGCATRINQDCLSLFAEEIGLEPESRLDFSLTGAPAVIHRQASQTTAWCLLVVDRIVPRRRGGPSGALRHCSV